jgi:hypothetical protein
MRLPTVPGILPTLIDSLMCICMFKRETYEREVGKIRTKTLPEH